MKKIILYLFVLFILAESLAYSQVKVYEGTEIIPTYKLGANEKSPIFYKGRKIQGAAGRFYPYPAQTKLAEKLSPVTYKMIYLENEYLKVTIIPEFGGKLFSAIDKTNGNEIFHRNSVIKPDLIGTLGAWISGGIEWCFPHHHRTSTLLPADYLIVQNDDGSVTVWVGETERDLRLRGVIGITLRPGHSYIEVDYRLNNPNNVTKNFQFWANVAVTADQNFRTFWPPSQEIGVFHSNKSFTQWPISKQVYNGIDYTSGVDLTWWKNHPAPVSFFYWQGKEGFIGGYNYTKKAGIVHVGNVNENKTSKLWQFGPGLQGDNARRKLTDDGRAYVELMTGTFSNNQPGYGWFSPHAVKDAKNYWYPLRDIEIVKNATIEASVTLQMRDSETVFYGFNTTKLYKQAKAILKYGDATIASNTLDIDPAHPFTSIYKSNKDLNEYKLYVELQDQKGNVLVNYRPYKPKYPEMPNIQEEPKMPGEIKTVEDLYLTGRFVEQFSRPFLNPDNYYLEALKRSPNDYRVNMAMGIRRINQWRYSEALEYLNKAAEKLNYLYYQPKEGELYYYLGLAYEGLGNQDKAYNNFFRATWYYEWYSTAYYKLALMESNKGNYAKALEFVKNAYSTNNYDGKINALYSSMLRKLGYKDEAVALANKLLEYDPLNFTLRYEIALMQDNGLIEKWQRNMQDIDNDHLEIAISYLNSGLFIDGIRILEQVKNVKNPLVYYYLAWFYSKIDQYSKSLEMIQAARNISLDYCFPYREETEKVLKYVIDKQPGDANAFYLLGNLLYDRRPSEAIEAWNKSVAINKNFSMAWRNLAFGSCYHENDIKKAIQYIKTAIQKDNNQGIWYSELENYYDMAGIDNTECIKIMEDNIDAVLQDIDAPKKLVNLYDLNEEYDKALELLKTHHFRTWELARDIHYLYVDANCLKAFTFIKDRAYETAIAQFNKAFLYPKNLEVGKGLDDERNAMIYYYMGETYEKMLNKGKADECYQKSINSKNSSDREDLKYYQAKAYEKLGKKDIAKGIFKELIDNSENLIKEAQKRSGISVEANFQLIKTLSNAYYIKALAFKGLGKNAEAKNLCEKSIKIYRNNLWANYNYKLMN